MATVTEDGKTHWHGCCYNQCSTILNDSRISRCLEQQLRSGGWPVAGHAHYLVQYTVWRAAFAVLMCACVICPNAKYDYPLCGWPVFEVVRRRQTTNTSMTGHRVWSCIPSQRPPENIMEPSQCIVHRIHRRLFSKLGHQTARLNRSLTENYTAATDSFLSWCRYGRMIVCEV